MPLEFRILSIALAYNITIVYHNTLSKLVHEQHQCLSRLSLVTASRSAGAAHSSCMHASEACES